MGKIMKKFAVVLACVFTCLLAQDASAAIKFKRFTSCPDGLVSKKTCECHAGPRSNRFEYCHAGQYCHTFTGECRK